MTDHGCHGGDFLNTFWYYFKDHYVMLESAYPYTSGAKGDDSTECYYSAADATNVKVVEFR